MLSSIKIFPNNKTLSDIPLAFKWMWHPIENLILVCSAGQNHSLALKSYKELDSYDFESWIRFVHILRKDYDKADNDIICVRPFDKSKYSAGNVVYLLNKLGMNDFTEFDITNERLQDITKNYSEKF